MKKYNKEDALKWYAYYKKVGSTRKVAEFFNVGRPTVKTYFREYGLKIKEDSRKYFIDEEFFDRDTPESFYWAGFIAADGCITGSSVNICLAEKDIEHLKKFKHMIGSDHKIYISDQRPIRNSIMASLKISSIKMVNSLQRFGIHKRKTFTYKIPKWVLEHGLTNHFIRGYVDGDGCFVVNNKSKLFNIRGTKETLSAVRNILHEKCDLKKDAKIVFESNMHRLAYAGRINIIRVRNFLYKNSNNYIELDRRKKLAFCDKIGSDIRPRNKMPVVSIDPNGKIIKFYSTQAETEIDGFSSSKVSICVSGKRKKHGGVRFRKATLEEIKYYRPI